MLILAVGLAALSLGVAGAALALALTGFGRTHPKGKSAGVEESEEERKAATEADKRIRDGVANLLGYDPYSGAGEGDA